MPKYYCDYCDTYLTHDSPSVRKTHNGGRRHKDNVRLYYVNWLERQAQTMMTQPGGMPGGMRPMAPGLLTAPGMMPPVPPPGMVMPPPMGMPPGPPRPGVMVPPFPPHMAAVPPPVGSAPIPGSQPPRPTGSVPAMPPAMTSS